MATLVFDSEIYRNYYLIMFKDIATGKHQAFEYPLDKKNVQRIIQEHELIGFNSTHYDLPLLGYALTGKTPAEVKAMSDKIIIEDMRPWELGLEAPECNHVDLIEVAPGQASLKIYGGRLHCPTMQDLPINPSAEVTAAQKDQLKTYCLNDLAVTEQLYRKLLPQIKLRERMTEEYGVELRSKSDAQIAEVVIFQGVTMAREGEAPQRKVKVTPGTRFKYERPDFITFPMPECEFVIADSGAPRCDALENYAVKIGDSTYRMGIGGLHSMEKNISHHADADTVLIDRDVASYYPSIILNCGLYPKHLGAEFLTVYRGLVQQRLTAKRSGDKVTADALKITINGSFGKLGSKYSCLYSPRLLIQVTLTGQLALLQLIQSIEDAGIKVVSANTDGVVIKCPRSRQGELNAIITLWEFWTGFETEETQYSAVYSRDVNNYLAVKLDGSVKTKGVFAESGLQKSPAGEIVTEAVIKHLTLGASVEATVTNCQDITKFLTVRTVTGGAVDQRGDYIGKAVRFYIGKGVDGALRYKKNGNKVAGSDSAIACMRLPDEFPSDVDYQHYINEANKILKGKQHERPHHPRPARPPGRRPRQSPRLRRGSNRSSCVSEKDQSLRADQH